MTTSIAGKKMDPEICKKLFADGSHDIRYRVMVRGKWSGIRSFRKRCGKTATVWPWDMIGAPAISGVEWWAVPV